MWIKTLNIENTKVNFPSFGTTYLVRGIIFVLMIFYFVNVVSMFRRNYEEEKGGDENFCY
jgi:hypothetical protein